MTKEEIEQQRQAVKAEASSWVGTKFHHLARVKGAGVDCAQFLAAVFEKVFEQKIQFPEFPGYVKGQYPPQWHLHDLGNPAKADFYLHAFSENEGYIEVDKSRIDVGDILLAIIGRTFCHGGIIVGWPMVIQAESSPLGTGKVTLVNANCNWFLTRRELKFFSRKEWHE